MTGEPGQVVMTERAKSVNGSPQRVYAGLNLKEFIQHTIENQTQF